MTDSSDFSFGLILVVWFLERVHILQPRFLLMVVEERQPRLMQWASIFVWHGGEEGGHYFTATLSRVWHYIEQIILRYPYFGMDYQQDPDMVLPPGEVWDQRGMLVYFMFCDFDSIEYVYIFMDVDTMVVCVSADVGPRG